MPQHRRHNQPWTPRRLRACPPADWLQPGMQRPRCCPRHRTQYDALMRALATPQPCLLCGFATPEYTGVFVPDRPECWGGTAGQPRVLVYALCAACCARPDKTLAIEARIQHGLDALAGGSQN